MIKPGRNFILFLLIALLITDCRKSETVSISNISDKPEAQAAFDSLLKIMDSDTLEANSKVHQLFYHTRKLLEESQQLLLYRKMGEFFYGHELHDSALIYFQKGLDIAKKNKNEYYTSVFHLMCGSVYHDFSDFDLALSEMKTAYNIAIRLDSTQLQVRTSRVLGNAYWGMGNYDLALEYYFISLDISQKTGNKRGIASALNNIGNVYQEVNNYDRAIEYYKKAIELAEKDSFARIIAISNNNVGDVYIIKKNYDSALVYIKKALYQVNKDFSRIDAGIYLGNVADIYLKTDSLEISKKYFIESLGFADEIGDKTGIASCNLGLAEVYLKESKPDIAESYLKTGTLVSEEIGSLKLMDYAYRLASDLSLMRRDYSGSRDFLLKQMSVKDSLYSLENGENVARLENQYKEVESIKQIELLKEKQKNFLYLSVLGITAFVIISTLIFIAYRQKTKTNILLSEKNLQIEASKEILEEKHQQLLKSQEQLNRINQGKDDFLTIISHDLKNPISTIRGFTELLISSYDSFSDEERKKFLHEVFDSIENISLLTNNILYWVRSQTNEIAIKPLSFNLLKRINENVSIYKLMFSNKEIQIEINVPENIQVFADVNVVDMILRNILSNSLKFTPNKGKIIISSAEKVNKIRLSISDSGTGIPEDKLKLVLNLQEQYSTTGTSHEKGTGLGLGLIYRFIERTGSDIFIESEQGKGTTISFSLDLA